MFNFIQIKPTGKYLTIIDKANMPRYMCFNKKMDALHCVTYISKFRSENGFFPQLDLTRNQTELHEELRNNLKIKKERTPESISKLLYIETLTPEKVNKICASYNINLFYIQSFAYMYDKNKDETKVLMAAQELNGRPDDYMYIAKLNEILTK